MPKESFRTAIGTRRQKDAVVQWRNIIQAELMHSILIHFRGKCALYRVKVCHIRTSLKNIL